MKKAFVLAQRFRIRARDAISKIGFKEEHFLILVSILIGATTGVFAHGFYWLIERAGELTYGHAECQDHLCTHGGLYGGRVWMLVVLPAAGALLVGCITHYFASEAKGHGVPEVMDAMYRKGGIIRPRVATAKAISSALTIGSGGSAGTEGPIIQIGAAIGSVTGQLLRFKRREMGILVACGVSAGIAAIFNAPIAGVLFALEIFLKDFSFRTFSPVVFSSVISCSIMHALQPEKDKAIFDVEELRKGVDALPGADAADLYLFAGKELPFYLVLGVLCAIAAVIFIKMLYTCEDLSDRLRIPNQLKPALGAIGLGVVGAAYVLFSSSDAVPQFFGNGYPAIEAAIGPKLLTETAGALILLWGLKLVATCLTLGSGGSGGIFAPSLLMGATLGGAFGLTLSDLGLIDDLSISAYALVGMAAMVAGTTHAPLTAIVIIYEITREPKAILPVMFAAIVATFGAQLIFRDSIYTLKLRRRGVRVGSLSDLTILRRITVDDVAHQAAPFVHPEDPLQVLIDLAGETEATDFVVVDEQSEYQGMVTGQDVRAALLQPEAVSLLLIGELLRSGVSTVQPDETLDAVLDKFARSDMESLPIVGKTDSTRVEGLITRQAVMRKYQEELDRQDR